MTCTHLIRTDGCRYCGDALDRLDAATSTYYVIQMRPPNGGWRDATGARYTDEWKAKKELEKRREMFGDQIGFRRVERTDTVLTD